MNVEDDLRRQMIARLSDEPPPDLVARSIAKLPLPGHSAPPILGPLRTIVAVLATLVAVLLVAQYTLPLSPAQSGPEGTSIAAGSDAPQGSGTAVAPTPLEINEADPTAAAGSVAPSPTRSDAERSAYFWSGVTHFLPYSYESDSLEGLAETAHLIVRGRIVDFNPGQLSTFSGVFGPSKTTVATIVVTEVLKGTPNSRVPGSIEVTRLGWSSLTAADAPAEEAVFFLWNYAQLREEQGVGPADPVNERYYYTRLNEYQCILPLVDGKVQVIAPTAATDLGYAERFPSELDGREFEELAAEIRTVAGPND
jgi:hypothetical protein